MKKITLPLAALVFVLSLIFQEWLYATPYSIGAYLAFGSIWLLSGKTVFRNAFRSLKGAFSFDENLLMIIASLGAFAINALPEAAAVMLFFHAGESLQERAVDVSRRSIRALADARPDTITLLIEGKERETAVGDARPGDMMLIKPGDRIALDAVVLTGRSSLDESALTGESLPREVGPGDEISAGSINLSGLITAKAERASADSAFARIISLVEGAAKRKAKTERLITSFARIYTPAVVLVALLTALVPPLFFQGASFADWAYRAICILVISCPCALMLSVPLGYFAGLGAASRKGVLVKGADYLDALSRVDTLAFDKTGTLTSGELKVVDMEPHAGFTHDELLDLAAFAEGGSRHPVAMSILAHAEARGASNGNSPGQYTDYLELPGSGVRASRGELYVRAGSDRFLHEEGIEHPESVCEAFVAKGLAAVHVAKGERYVGAIGVGDKLRHDSASVVDRLKRLGLRRVAMLSGDSVRGANRVAGELGIEDSRGGLTPQGKLEALEGLIAERDAQGGKHGSVVAVGDGINDAPILARADVGVAMGARGTEAAIEAADVVVMGESLGAVVDAMEIARKTRVIVRENILFALGFKAVFIALGFLGAAAIWEAVFADVGVALLAIANSSRIIGSRKRAQR